MKYFDPIRFTEGCDKIKEQSPMIHCITSYVSARFVNNTIIAIGASPFMSYCPEEMEEVVNNSDALVVNSGTLNSEQVRAMKTAASLCNDLGKHWVLEPVAFGASKYRNDTNLSLVNDCHPSIIRGNVSEIYCMALAMGCSPVPVKEMKSEEEFVSTEKEFTPGVEKSISLEEAVGMAVSLSRLTGSVIGIGGTRAFVTDGERVACISNNSQALRYSTGSGCSTCAFAAAFLYVDDDPFQAMLNASALIGVAAQVSTAPNVLRPLGHLVKGLNPPDWMQGPYKNSFMFTLRTFIPEAFSKMVKEDELTICSD